MPTPPQARLNLPVARRHPEDAPTFTAIEFAMNGLPHFHLYRRHMDLTQTSNSYTMSSTSFVDLHPPTDGLLEIARFHKTEPWTNIDINFRGGIVRQSGSSNARGIWRAVITNVNTGEVVATPLLGKHQFNADSLHDQVWGEARVEGIPPGVYQIKVQWATSLLALTLSVNFAADLLLTAQETIPAPTY